jgi:hypothetical protein
VPFDRISDTLLVSGYHAEAPVAAATRNGVAVLRLAKYTSINDAAGAKINIVKFGMDLIIV